MATKNNMRYRCENGQLWPSELNELKLKTILSDLMAYDMIPNIGGLAIQLIVIYNGNMSTKCINFKKNDRENRSKLFVSPKPFKNVVNRFTIELWLNVDAFTDNVWQTIRNGHQWAGNMIHFQFFGDTLELARHGNVTHCNWFTEYKFEAKTWYHIAVTYPNFELYVNGRKISENRKDKCKVRFENGTIGHWNNGRGNDAFDRMFYGKMKEFRVWNTIRTEQEINDHLLRAAKPFWIHLGLIMYFSLDDATSVKDLCYHNKCADKFKEMVTDEFDLDSINIVQ
eukprot:414737_1